MALGSCRPPPMPRLQDPAAGPPPSASEAAASTVETLPATETLRATIQLQPLAGSDALRDAFTDAKLPADTALEDEAVVLRFLAVVAPRLGAVHRDCDKGSQLACWLWDDLYGRAVTSTRKVGTAARSALRAQCDAGHSLACAVAAESLDHPSGISGKPVLAVTEMMKTCRAGWTGVCVSAARIRYGSGIDMVALSGAEAVATFDSACKKGFVEACEMVAYRTGAYDPSAFVGSVQHRAHAHSCSLGSYSSCTGLLTMLSPEPPFGCDRCDPKSMGTGDARDVEGNFEERCIDCYISTCRAKHCCADCASKYACCGQENADRPTHPAVAPPLPRANAKRIIATAEQAIAEALVLWKAGCERGHPQMCLQSRVDEAMGTLRARLDQLTQHR